MITRYRAEIEQITRSFSDAPDLLEFWHNTLQTEYDSRGIHPTHSKAKEAIDSALISLLKQFPQTNSQIMNLTYNYCLLYDSLPSQELLSALKAENQEQERELRFLELALIT